MTKSLPLRLSRLFFPVVSVKAVVPKEGQSRGLDLRLADLNLSFAFDFQDDGKAASSAFRIETKEKSFADPGTVPPYAIDVEVVAHFEVLMPEYRDDRATYFRKFAAASALIGAAREQVAMMTARGPWGSVFMPMIDVNSIVGSPPPKPVEQTLQVEKHQSEKRVAKRVTAPKAAAK